VERRGSLIADRPRCSFASSNAATANHWGFRVPSKNDRPGCPWNLPRLPNRGIRPGGWALRRCAQPVRPTVHTMPLHAVPHMRVLP
jgi:hypothetical protein